ncbi:MAG TPA: TA system VapC family ribonuclease toxin [Vicinamibacterales bacterium]|nr:TA system VapC family ribonuclease toxin [Vicinamibacterales bacterium]
MILVDANLLVYAANRAAPEHDAAREWLDARLSGSSRVGLPWPSLLAFVRIVSNPMIMARPVTPAEAWRQVREWLACEAAWIPVPGPRHAALLEPLLRLRVMTSRLVPDAHLAALAIEHGLTLCSTDGDFARFPGLRWENPLAARGRPRRR